MTLPPFSKGDLLCIAGGGVTHGKHIHEAGEPVLRNTTWHNGHRKWGYDDDVILRHATVEDVDHCLKLENDILVRTLERIRVLNSQRKRLVDEGE